MRADESTDWQADDTVDEISKPWPGLAVQLFTPSATERKTEKKNEILEILKNDFSFIHELILISPLITANLLYWEPENGK